MNSGTWRLPRSAAPHLARRREPVPVLSLHGVVFKILNLARLPWLAPAKNPWRIFAGAGPPAPRSRQPFFNPDRAQHRGMNEHLPDHTEETMLQTLRRRYAHLTSWLLRLNRLPEPSRLPEPTRTESRPRILTPARKPHPPRPE